jgi:hypothetical protein
MHTFLPHNVLAKQQQQQQQQQHHVIVALYDETINI